jgi:hypothetical protein
MLHFFFLDPPWREFPSKKLEQPVETGLDGEHRPWRASTCSKDLHQFRQIKVGGFDLSYSVAFSLGLSSKLKHNFMDF